MADIFISYAHEDKPRVEVLARALEAEGFSVWWDDRLKGGETFNDVIEAELAAATSVIVVWTEASHGKSWVRSEARWADKRGKLLPVMFDPDALPLYFDELHTENFVGWSGERSHNGWKRLIEQLAARSDAARLASRAKSPLQGPAAIRAEGAQSALTTSMLTVLLTLAALTLATIPVVVPEVEDQPGIRTFLYALALGQFFYILFVQADGWLKPQTKALVGRWLMPAADRAQVTLPQAFLGMFEAVFTRRHFGLACFTRSAVASTVAFAIAYAVLERSLPNSWFAFQMGDTGATYYGGLQTVLLKIALTIAIPNIIGDFLSLWETRLILRAIARWPKLLVPLVVIDAVLTGIIFIGFLFLVSFGFGIARGTLSPADIPAQAMLELNGLLGTAQSIWLGDLDNTHGIALLLASLVTSFITSVWLWLVLALSPVMRVLLWGKSGVTVLGRALGVESRPVAALGLVIAVLVILAGGGIAVSEALAGGGAP